MRKKGSRKCWQTEQEYSLLMTKVKPCSLIGKVIVTYYLSLKCVALLETFHSVTKDLHVQTCTFCYMCFLIQVIYNKMH